MTTLRISELAARGGVPATTVRYYEQLGLLSPPPRTADNQRRYGDSAVAELRFVRQAKHLGLSLTEIGELVAIAAPAGAPRCSPAWPPWSPSGGATWLIGGGSSMRSTPSSG